MSSVPAITIDDVQQLEGDDATSIVFTVTRSGKSNQASTVDYATVGSSATPGDDYESAIGTLVFAPGDKTKTIGVTVHGDLDSETDEEFFVNLSNPTNAKFGDDQGVGTIENDDFGPALPTISIDDVQQVEGGSGITSFVFTVTRSGDTSGTASIDYQTADGTATLADNDYAALPVTALNFAANETTKTISVDVTGDSAAEPNETFFVNLSNPAGATVGDSQGQGTIEDDDAPAQDTIYVYSITSDTRQRGPHTEVQFTIDVRIDSDHDGDPENDGPAVGVVVVLSVYDTAVTELNGDSNIRNFVGTLDEGLGSTYWYRLPAPGNYHIEVHDLALSGYLWDHVLESSFDDEDDDGRPDFVLSVL